MVGKLYSESKRHRPNIRRDWVGFNRGPACSSFIHSFYQPLGDGITSRLISYADDSKLR